MNRKYAFFKKAYWLAFLREERRVNLFLFIKVRVLSPLPDRESSKDSLIFCSFVRCNLLIINAGRANNSFNSGVS